VPAEASVGAEARASDRYDGLSATDLTRRLAIPHLELYATVPSTMDAAHALAATGAASGTLVLADQQTAGRGRQGRPWASAAGQGIWLTLLARPTDEAGLQVLSLRVGLAAAAVLEPFAPDRVRIKWPNDLYVGDGKLAGILVEARWRNGTPEWVAVGVGVNVRVPRAVPSAAGLVRATRPSVLESLVPAIRSVAEQTGPLTERELALYDARDYARGRRCASPARGVVTGVSAAGELAVRTAAGIVHCRAGSLVLEEER
jgi:BirA family biotin operon repressor/biotin-[acetyl-CoA-carboxylase] ligase